MQTKNLSYFSAFRSIKREAAAENAYVELKGRSLTTGYSMVDFMNMSIASGVDGIWLEYTGEEGLQEKIDDAVMAGIPVITLLNDAPVTKRSSYVGINSYQLDRIGKNIVHIHILVLVNHWIDLKFLHVLQNTFPLGY